MALSVDTLRQYTQRLLRSRLRILNKHPFYGLLLMHMKFSVDEKEETACTDGENIVFGTVFLDDLNDKELDFVMMHEILHVVLQHWNRVESFQHEEFNRACDIVVNSIILQENNMNIDSITLKKYGESMHLAPNGREGHEFSAEEVYHMLYVLTKTSGDDSEKGFLGKNAGELQERKRASWDNHTKWGEYRHDSILQDAWEKRFVDACEAISIREASNQCGGLPMFAKRMLQRLRESQTDWKTILNNFIQQDIVDYSFLPPDRRFEDNPFFLPDFNEKEDVVEDILFMIDTSGSMSDEMIASAYCEVKGAIDQFDGRLKGWLGFFDAEVIAPKPFESEDEFRMIYPGGGGGTKFHSVFEYVKANMMDNLPTSIIILTDGYARFPREDIAMEIPVLWMLNNEDVNPPWGKVARINSLQ